MNFSANFSNRWGRFLGSHLCDRLISDGYEVKCLENFLTGSKVNICHLLASKRFEIIRDDITIPL